jgi:hypothetical protein
VGELDLGDVKSFEKRESLREAVAVADQNPGSSDAAGERWWDQHIPKRPALTFAQDLLGLCAPNDRACERSDRAGNVVPLWRKSLSRLPRKHAVANTCGGYRPLEPV